jgi:hypothetical protein
MQVWPRDGSCALHQRRDRTDGLKFHRAADEGTSMTTRHRTIRALANAMTGFIRIAPKKALAAHSNEEDLRDRLDRALELLVWNIPAPRSTEELAYLYAATYTDPTEGEPIR